MPGCTVLYRAIRLTWYTLWQSKETSSAIANDEAFLLWFGHLVEEVAHVKAHNVIDPGNFREAGQDGVLILDVQLNFLGVANNVFPPPLVG